MRWLHVQKIVGQHEQRARAVPPAKNRESAPERNGMDIGEYGSAGVLAAIGYTEIGTTAPASFDSNGYGAY
ncbi:hypothetical protein GGTG_00542 [Gaeumannomyces tritici R3-111a-1]|uniref:Uncharacterized protein n=1 Tax=Gaeumannomyces tritici (strain R3-111a-1) TaxID=644352 RepID=J3NH07_GAET3|nr:hypothetical protein GGTG_00542 [Gaeumannomyces tritici R3-111a-1]EJT80547.1 hypothetical protein GGTG_00542 [Gaeumannomyces tritici R3-111a-1]